MKLRKIKCSISLLLSCILAMHSGIAQSLMVNAEFINDSSTICSTPEEKIDSAVYDSITSGEENIPVVIWYKDIDQAYVESEITKRVGFSLEEIEVTYEPPSSELLTALNEAAAALDNSVSATTIIGEQTETNALDSTVQMNSNKLDSYLKLLMNTHMEMTESARELERNRTESYLEAKSEIVKEQYTLASAEMKTALALTDDEMLFTSRYAPMLVCELTAGEILEISQNDDVVEISYFEPLEIEECITSSQKNTITNSMGFSNIHNDLGLTGAGIGIGIYETASVLEKYSNENNFPYSDSKVHIIGESFEPINSPGHATYCASVAAGTYGLAPDAVIYSASLEYDWQDNNGTNNSNTQLSMLEDLIDTGVEIINISWSAFSHHGNETDSYTYWEKYMDDLISTSGVTIVCSSGNNNSNIVDSQYVTCPAMSYNCITVNGFSNNRLNNYSYNHGEGCYKPDVIAESLNNGTSTAAPVISGMIALLYQYKPSLMAYPQVVKAILMASSHQKMTHLEDGTTLSGESLYSGLTDRQGAGVPNMYRMISMAAAHTYGVGTLSSSNGYTESINFVQPKYNGTNINICMAYLQTAVSTTSPAITAENCDISLNYGSSSDKINSSTEMIYASMPSTSNYTLTIDRKSGTLSKISYGYAWSTDNTEFYQYRDEEGIYYLKNAKSSKYLNMNNSTLAASQGSFSSTNSPWVLKYSYNNNKYTIQSANGTDKGLTLGSSLSGGYRAVGTTSTYTPSITMSQNPDGTYTFIQNRNGTKYALGIYSGSQSNNVVAVWSPFTPETSNSNEPTDKSQKWYLSTLAYRKGDVNMDGAINSIDASAALSIGSQLGASGSTTYSNASLFLADYDNDGSVNSIDASIIMQNYT